MRRFQKEVPAGHERKHPGQLFREAWDYESIKTELYRARRARDLPRFELDKIEFHPARTCNLHCSWCHGKDVVPPVKARGELTCGDIQSVLQDIRRNMPKLNPLILYAGLYSEPLMNPACTDMVALAGEAGFRFGIYTNGMLFQPALSSEVALAARKNPDPRPSYVTFNLTSSFALRRGGLERLLEKIHEVHEARRRAESPLLLNGSVLATKEYPIEDSAAFLSEAQAAGLDNVRFSFPWPAQRNETMRLPLTPEQYASFSREFTRLEEQHPGFVSIRFPPQRYFNHCFVGTLAASISPEGDVFLCPEVSTLLFRETHSYGNIRKTPFSRIWQGDRHKQLFLNLNPYTVKKRCVCGDMGHEMNLCCSAYWDLAAERT